MKDQLEGKRIELISISDPYTNLRPGNRGTVDFVDEQPVTVWQAILPKSPSMGISCVIVLPGPIPETWE